MNRVITTIISIICSLASTAATYSYKFDRTNLADALATIAEQHPDIKISFIYNELDQYVTSATIDTDGAYQALRQAIGMNPVSIIRKGNQYYIEALQHGKYRYSGNVVDEDNEPVPGAIAVVLSPRDSTVITYGVTDSDGRFSIPCDRKNIIVKLSSVGYKTTYVDKPPFAVGTVKLRQNPIELSAVSVEASNTTLASDKNTYIPTSTQKNASQDAIDLLRRMAIPQLVISPDDNNVKDVFGNSIPVFINYLQAQPDELKGMKMTDVRKIEYIEFPTDPRFNGERRVVNFIVQEYEYGGYTKVTESMRTLSGLFNSTGLFSRLTYKRMTYEIYAGSENEHYHHSGADNVSTYMLQDNGEEATVTRRETYGRSDITSNEYPVTLRATYATPRFTMRNALSFTHGASPTRRTTGDLAVDRNAASNYTYTRNDPYRNNTISYHGNYWGMIGQSASIDITPGLRHTHRNNIASYESTLMQEPIYNAISENTYNWGLQATGRVVFGQKNQVSLFVSGGQNINKLEYRGTNNSVDSYYITFLGGVVRYRYQSRRLSLTTFAGVGYDHNSMNGIKTGDVYPRLGLNAWISLNQKSQLSAYLSYQTTTPDISMKANDIVRSNEYMYLTANPNLSNWRNFSSNLSYNRYWNNSFSLAAFAGYEQDFNRVATIYEPYDDGKALLRDFINDGAYIHYYIGVSANVKLFNNSLQLYANLTQNAYDITGRYSDSLYPFRLQLQGVYYWKSFNILASYGNPERKLTENSNYIIRGRNFHMVSVGWGNGAMTVNLSAKNIFNKGWRSETWRKHSPLYTDYQQHYSPSAHPSINLSVTYTIGYGKKIQRGNEATPESTAPSAIIK